MMNTSRAGRCAASVGVALVGGAAVVSCGVESLEQGATAAPPYSWAWSELTAAEEAFYDPTIEGMAAEADIVAVGHFTEPCEDRIVTGDVPIDEVLYTCYTFAVGEVVSGSGPETVPVEFLGRPDDPSTVPSQEVLVFLVEKQGPRENGKYRSVNSSGLWTSTERATVDQPMRDAPPSSSTQYRTLELETWEDFLRSVKDRF